MPSATLIAEATRRSGAVWVGLPQEQPSLLWHVWHDGAAYVVGGGPEQHLPVGPGDRALVVVRSKAAQAGVVVEWPASVEAVLPETPLWEQVVPLLAAERLNAEAGRAGRWAKESSVLRLSPVPD
ncbi:MAG: hypothetical protein WD794_09980 [Mycobacteriales bacterium]